MPLAFTPPGLITPRGYIKPASLVIDPAHPLSRGLVACWPLGDVGSGSSAQIGPNGGISTNNGTITLAGSHHGGLASNFNGSTGYITNTINSFLSNSFSFSCWVAQNAGVTAEPMMAMSSNQASNYWAALQMSRGSGANKPGFALYDGTHNPEIDGGTALTANVWYHLVAIRDKAAGKIQLYVNAVSQGTVTDTTTSVPAYSVFSVGACSTFSTSSRDWAGLLEGARVYARALTPSEIAWLYAEPYAGLVPASPAYLVGVAAAAGGWGPLMAQRRSRFVNSGMVLS